MAFTGEEPGRTADSIRDLIRMQKNDSQLPKPCIHIRVGITGVGLAGVGIAGVGITGVRIAGAPCWEILKQTKPY